MSIARSRLLALSAVIMTAIVTTPSAGSTAIATPATTHAQSSDSTYCCTVVRVDSRRGIVTARETATGYTFSIEVKRKKVLAALKIGDKVWADFAVKKVRLGAAGDALCCAIVETTDGDTKDRSNERSKPQEVT